MAYNWPGPLVGFVLGRLSEEDVRSRISAQPILRARQTCQAAFYFGVLRLLQRDNGAYVEYMRESCSQGAVCPLEPEFYLAAAEAGECAGGGGGSR